MGLRVATNVPSQVSQRYLQEASANSARSMARLASGQRIASASDDAAGLAISNNLQAEIRGLKQAQRNANDGVSFVQTAEGALNEVSNLLIRLRELGVQAASDTLGDQERGFLNKEFSALKEEIDRVAQVTTYDDRPLLNGNGSTLNFQVGPRAGENQVIHFDPSLANTTISNLGIRGANVSSRDAAADSLESVDSAIAKINDYRAGLGALQTRLHSSSNTLAIHVENLSEARSRIADTDIAEEAANLARSSVIESAGIAVLAQANAAPGRAIKLL